MDSSILSDKEPEQRVRRKSWAQVFAVKLPDGTKPSDRAIPKQKKAGIKYTSFLKF